MRQAVERAIKNLLALPADAFAFSDADRATYAAAHKDLTAEMGRGGKKKSASAWKPDPPELIASRKIVHERSGGICEAQTPWCEHFATQVHHIAGRVGKGCHAPEMLLDVCGNGNLSGCHGYIEQHIDDATAYERGWLRSRLGTVRP